MVIEQLTLLSPFKFFLYISICFFSHICLILVLHLSLFCYPIIFVSCSFLAFITLVSRPLLLVVLLFNLISPLFFPLFVCLFTYVDVLQRIKSNLLHMQSTCSTTDYIPSLHFCFCCFICSDEYCLSEGFYGCEETPWSKTR